MKYLKYALYALGALVVIVGAVFASVAVTFDPNAYKDDITRLVREKTGRTLTIEGAIRLTMFPKIGVSLGETRLSEFGGAQEFAGVDDLRVSLALVPLLSKQIVVDNVVIDGLRARLVKNRDGKTNIDDLLAKGEDAKSRKTKPAGASTTPAVKLDIEGVNIRQATLVWKDEQTGAEYKVSDLFLKTGRVAQGIPTGFEFAATINANQPKLDLRTKAAGTLNADLEQQVYKLTGLKAEANGVVANVTGLAVTLAADIEAQLAPQRIRLSTVRLDASGALGSDSLNARIEAPNVVFDQGALAVEQLVAVLAGNVAGVQLSEARVRVSAVEGSAQALKLAELAIDLDAKQAQNAIKGRLATPVAANLETQVFELSKLGGQFDIRSPALPMKATTIAVAGNATADLKRETVSADLMTKFDKSNIKAKLGMKRFAKPWYSFDVAIDKLDVDKYMPPKQDKTAGKPAGGEHEEAPFDLSVLKNLNLDGSVRIGELIASNVKAANVRIDIKAANGKVEINPLSANLYQGTVNSVVGIDANLNQFAVKQSLSGVSVGALLRDALDKDLLEGRGDIGLDVTATGNTVSALKRTLTGAAKLGLKDGALKGINLGQSIRGAKNMLATKSARESAASPTEKTDFSELMASFTIKDGKAHNEDLSMKSPFLRLTGAGDIDIAEGGLNYLAKASVVATSTGQEGKDLADVAGLSIPVRVSGPVNALKYKLEFGNAVAASTRQQLQEKKEALKSKLERRLQDKLLGGSKPADPAALQGEAQPGQEAAQNAQPAAKPEEQVKKRLKNLFR